jgi:hypothetical protein
VYYLLVTGAERAERRRHTTRRLNVNGANRGARRIPDWQSLTPPIGAAACARAAEGKHCSVGASQQGGFVGEWGVVLQILQWKHAASSCSPDQRGTLRPDCIRGGLHNAEGAEGRGAGGRAASPAVLAKPGFRLHLFGCSSSRRGGRHIHSTTHSRVDGAQNSFRGWRPTTRGRAFR